MRFLTPSSLTPFPPTSFKTQLECQRLQSPQSVTHYVPSFILCSGILRSFCLFNFFIFGAGEETQGLSHAN